MGYTFPRIETINDVLPAIEGRDEFIVAEREHYTIVNYVVSMPDTFPVINTVQLIQNFDVSEPIFETRDDRYAAIRRECRGIVFYDHMVNEFHFGVTAYYIEEGMGFVGKFTDTDGDEFFEYDFSENDNLDDIPDDIVDEFDLRARLEDYLAEMAEEEEHDSEEG